MRGAGFTGLLVALAFPVALRAQPAPVVRPGMTVRVWATQPALSSQEGTVVAQAPDTLRIRRRLTPHGDYAIYDTVPVAWSDVRQVEVRLVSHSGGALKGLLWGLGTGVLAGSGLASASDEENAIIAVPILGIAGAVVGILVGGAAGSEQWWRVYP